jgi:hypothetical protein
MQELLSQSASGTEYEDPKRWIVVFQTDFDTLSNVVGLSLTSLQTGDISTPKVQSRLRDVHAILSNVEPWVGSWGAAWQWYCNAKIPGFDYLSSSQVVSEHGVLGISIVRNHIKRKSFGGFA